MASTSVSESLVLFDRVESVVVSRRLLSASFPSTGAISRKFDDTVNR